MRVALDAMGGDRAPSSAVEGALLALDRDEDLSVDLIGREPDVREHLGDRDHPRLTIRHAPDVLRSDEAPVRGAREHPESSVHVCLSLVRDGEADAVVSAGDTGAVLAAATMILRRIRGVGRPGIAVSLPRADRITVLCDAGANLGPRAVHLMQYGLMASELARVQLDIAEPRVGLLSVGTEIRKGSEVIRKADALLRRAPLNYVGLVEGQELYDGDLDVVVSDGFTGNVVLKACEGFAAEMGRQLSETGEDIPIDARRLDFASVGGAPLLGVRGVVVVGHGRSGPRAIANGVRAAAECVRQGLVERLATAAFRMSPLGRAARLLPSRAEPSAGEPPRAGEPSAEGGES